MSKRYPTFRYFYDTVFPVEQGGTGNNEYGASTLIMSDETGNSLMSAPFLYPGEVLAGAGDGELITSEFRGYNGINVTHIGSEFQISKAAILPVNEGGTGNTVFSPSSLLITNNDSSRIQTYTSNSIVNTQIKSALLENPDTNVVTDNEKTTIANLSGVNTGDETTSSIQTKRPLKTVQGQSIEGIGDISISSTEVKNLLLAEPDTNIVDDLEKFHISNLSGVNTGDESMESIQAKRPLKTIQGQSIEGVGDVLIPTSSNVGDVKASFVPTDHSQWVLLNGRALSLLSTSQQNSASVLGWVGNIPNASNSVLRQNGLTLGGVSGSNLISQANLPNAVLSGTTNTSSHAHTSGTSGSGDNRFGEITASAKNVASTNTTATAYAYTSTESHSHTLTTSSINGGVTQTAFTPQTLSVNYFVYL